MAEGALASNGLFQGPGGAVAYRKSPAALFDGLDELGEDLRKPCLEAIAEFGKARLAQYVICSRIVEYSETVDAPVYCQVMVKPLTITQIREGLQEVNSPETNGILDAMKKDPFLKEAIKTPFYLNTVQLLFAASKVWEEFDFKAKVFFLNVSTTQNLLESNGGSWRFRHRILQEYFAEHWAAVYGATFPRGVEEDKRGLEVEKPAA